MTIHCVPAASLCLLLLATTAAPLATATEPLHDHYTVGKLTGTILPTQCCWLTLPSSPRLQEIRLGEGMRCSAIGGPVGMFELKAGALWLTGLRTCGREIALREVYPGSEEVVRASWISGSFTTKLGYLCYQQGRDMYQLEQSFNLDRGIVTSITEKRGNASMCPQQDANGG